ncbi:hypothetical protein, partial [Kaarinaea lacus]
TGMLTEAQAEAALEAANMQEEILKIGQAIADGLDPEEAQRRVDQIKRVISDFTLEDLLGTKEDYQVIPDISGPRSAIGGLYEDAQNLARNPIADAILGDDPETVIGWLEELREGVEVTIRTEGYETTMSQLGDIYNKVQEIAGSYDVTFNVEDNGGGGNEDTGRIGGPLEQFGGPVQQGASYIVGDRRPEVFVPNVNGRIYPSTNGMGNSTTNIFNYNREAAAISMAMLGLRRNAPISKLAGVAR